MVPYAYSLMRTQTLVQLSDRLLAALDELSAVQGRSRSELIREAIESYLAESLEAQIDRQIVDAYRRQPAQEIWGEAAAKQLIEAEPW